MRRGAESMTSRQLTTLHRDLDLIAGSGSLAGLGDVELLEQFIARRDAARPRHGGGR